MLRKNQKGQGMTEFALILPILLLLLLGIIEGGRIVWGFITVQNAAREAARYAVTGRPFACPTDPDPDIDPTAAANPDNYCDDATQGDPWSPQVPDDTRVKAIKKVAVEYARMLNIKYEAITDEDEYDLYKDSPGAYGVNVLGQDATDPGGRADYAGQPGWNVRVEVYYNIEMFDPLYAVIADYIHLNGETELQNEGIDPNATGYQGGITYQTDNCAPNCGGGSTPFILIQDEFGDFSEPQGGKFTVSVNDHQPNTAYKVWFVHKDGLFSDSLDFTTDNLGGKLVNFIISASAPPGPEWDYRIYTTLASGTNPVASCKGDLPTNAPCFRVEQGNASIEVRNITQGDELQQPLTTARWPISSSIPIYLFGHDTNKNYTIKFDGLISTLAPGTLKFDGSTVTEIPTDSQFGTNLGNIPAYYIATGHTPGSNVQITSEDVLGTEVASTTVEFIEASIFIAGETPGTTHPAGDILFITLLDHAPLQQYRVFFDDGITPAATVRANADGKLNFNYVVPDGVHTPSPTDAGDPNYVPPVPVEIYTLDYGRGTNPNKIASRTVSIFTPIEPYINVPGGAKWPAGSPITIQLRRHKPDTDYDVYLQQGTPDSPSFSEQINSTITTHNINGQGEYDMVYVIPASYVGFYVIRSFEPLSPTAEVAAFDIEFTSNPYITIDHSKRWPPGSKVTIRLKNHAILPHDVWLDRGGTQETFLGTVIIDATGEGTVEYTIPQTMPTKIEPGYPVESYLNDILVAETDLEVKPADLIVSKIDVPNVTFDIEVPITLTVYNNSPVTVTDTYFDTDIYVDPPVVPNSTDDGLPPGVNKNWLDFVPPYGSVLVEDDIVLFGQQSHQVYARADTTNWVAEDDETNNVAFKSIDAACPVEISDEFLGDGLSEWTQTDFGDSGPACSSIPDLPPVSGAGTELLNKNWDGLSSNLVTDPPDGTGYEGFTFVQDPAYSVFGTSGSTLNYIGRSSGGDPVSSLYVGPRRNGSNLSSSGAWIEFTNTMPDVTISFKYLLRSFNTESWQDEWAEYYFIIDPDRVANSGDEITYDGGTGNGYLVRGVGPGDYPSGFSQTWPEAIINQTLAPGTHRLFFGVKAAPMSWDDEYAVGYIDALVVTESSGLPSTPPDPAGTIWSAHYSTDADLFGFAKDEFYGLTSNAEEDPSGTRVTDMGATGATVASLYTKLGRSSGGSTYTNMTGGWSRTFTVPAGSSCVTVQGYYRLKFDALYESDEVGEVLIAVDNGASPRVLESVNGSGSSDYDSGWVAFNESFSLSPGAHTLILGGYNNKATENGEIAEIWFDDVYVVDTGSGTSSSSQTESSGTLIMSNNGSGALSADDNGSNAGYHLMHQTVGSGPFEVYVRVDQAPPSGSNGLAGLEIRGDYSSGASAKIMLVYNDNNQVKLYTRVSGASVIDKKTASGVSGPVWLKISRNGDVFEIDYAPGASDTPPTDWGNAWTTLTNFTMPASVEVGLINSPGSTSAKEAHFKHFHVCAASAPGGSSGGGQGYLGNQCGQVEENGNGQVVIDAVNTIINQSGAGHTWQVVTVNNVLGESSMDGLEADPDSGADLSAGAGPHATYQVNVQSAGTYYVWVAGWGPNGSGNSVHVGLNGSAAGTIDGFPTGGSAPGWVKMSGSLSINAGINTIDLWMKEDGARVFKIVLTQDNNFIPSPEGMSQSACTVIVEPHVPPLMEKCFNPIRKGDFEGTYADVLSEWPTGNLTTFSYVSYSGNRGVGFPAFAGRMPWMYQTFEIPDLSPVGILTDTRVTLKFNRGVDLNGGSSNPGDKLYFTLRRASDNFQLIPPVLLADGQDRTMEVPPIPDLDPSTYPQSQWTEFSANVVSGLNPINVLEPGDTVRAYFYVSDPGVDTNFFIDNVSLKFCSTQAEPGTVAGSGKVSGVAQVGGIPTGGVNVWAYAYADEGSNPGPVSQTYSLDDGTYRFYNLPPGSYLIYAEVQTAQGTFSASRLILVTAGGDVTNLVLNVDTA